MSSRMNFIVSDLTSFKKFTMGRGLSRLTAKNTEKTIVKLIRTKPNIQAAKK